MAEQWAGGFRLIRELASGGFGSVYLGQDASGRRAAIKFLHPHLANDPQVRRYFAQELVNARRVQGFCLAEILDADAEAPRPWIATEYIDGPTLAQAVREHGPRTGGDLQRLAVQTITALSAVHAAGVVHRDLKPANILLGPDGPRVIDFGIARVLDADTSSATRIGTVGYMAPEQLEGTTLGPSADLFAWGAVMIYAATGGEAFPSPSQAARIKRVLTGSPETGDLAAPMLDIVLACMAKDPAERPTARQVLDMLITGRATSPPPANTRFDYTDTSPVLDPASWNNRDTDSTPFTADALLARRFTDEKGVEFTLVGAGARPCGQMVTGDGPLTAKEVFEEITAHGCTQVMAGLYEERASRPATGRPLRVSVSIFPFPDDATARTMYDYLNGLARWHLTTWHQPDGADIRPLIPGRQYYRHSRNRVHFRYLVTVMAYRSDLTRDGDLEPWLTAASEEAANSAGPQS